MMRGRDYLTRDERAIPSITRRAIARRDGELRKGKLSVNEARAQIGLPPIIDDLTG